MSGACTEMLHAGKGSCLSFGCLMLIGILVLISHRHGRRCTDTFGYQEVATLNSRVASELSGCASGSLFPAMPPGHKPPPRVLHSPGNSFLNPLLERVQLQIQACSSGLLSALPSLCSLQGITTSGNLNPTNLQAQALPLQEGH